ncbi:MAG: SpoIID/LytB domain-containing protein [Armatimonadota bacterium]|nr:SpoIID/LytB domain-containing protein [Armatimonadota bacterium]
MIRATVPLLLCALLVGGGLSVSGPAPVAEAQAARPVRVGLLLEQDLVTIGSDGPFDLSDAGGSRRETREGGRVTFRVGGRTIDTEAGTFTGPLRLQPRSGFLQVNGRPYRGLIEIRRTPSGRLTVINEVDVEEYLYGVVRSEMDPRWPAEALRAQAIAARSIATVGSGRFAAEGYDVRSNTDSQVYGGVAAEDPRTSAAVDATRGLVILYEGRPVFAPFHADSGGATEGSEFVWGGAVPYLRGVPDPFSREAPNHQWTQRLDVGAVEAALQRAGRTVSGLQRIEVLATSPSGRVMMLRLTMAGGVLDLRGADLRAAVGVGVLRSTLFTVRWLSGESAVEFSGRGSGHGVGMSQWGARGQALAGRDHAAILTYYYTGVAVGPRP